MMRLHSFVYRTLVLGVTLALCAPYAAPAFPALPVPAAATFAQPMGGGGPLGIPARPQAMCTAAVSTGPRADLPSALGRFSRHEPTPRAASAGLRIAAIAPRVLPVDSSAVYSDGYWMWADGVVTNNGPGAVRNVTVTVDFLNNVGTEIGSADIKPEDLPFDVIDAGASAAFSWALMWWDAAPPAGTVDYRFEAVGDVVSDGSSALLLPVQVVDMQPDADGWRNYTVSVTNDRSDDVTATLVTGYEQIAGGSHTFVDAMGSYAAYNRRLTPGESMQVRLVGGRTLAGTLDTPALRAEAQYVDLAPGLNVFETDRTCAYGGTLGVDGHMVDGTLADVTNAVVGLKTSTDGGRTWKTLTPLLTDSTGRFFVTMRPTRRTLCRFTAPGVKDADMYVTPLAALSEPNVPAHAATKRAFTVSGTLKPKHTAGSKAVRLETAFVDANYVQTAGPTFYAKATTYKSYSKYAGSVTFSKKGLWLVRAVVTGDSLHATTATAWHDLMVGESTLSLKSSRSKVSYAKSAVLTATLRDATKHGLSKRTIQLEQYDSDADTYTPLKTARTNSAGLAKFTVKPEFGADYRVTFAGDSSAYGDESNIVSIDTSAYGAAMTGSGELVYLTPAKKLSAGWHQVVLYDNSGARVEFGLFNSALTKWASHCHWITNGATKSTGRFHLSKTTTLYLGIKTAGDFVIFVW